MHDILGESLRRIKKNRTKRIRTVAILLALSLIVSLDVFWTLRRPGLTLAGDADCGIVEHSHDSKCKGTEGACALSEHVHTVQCYSNESSDVETQLDWQKMFKDYPFTGNISRDLVGIAKTQVGYTESKLNFEVSPSGERHGYTRYGAWYGTPYGDWSATFVSFCLHYAGADPEEYPTNTGALSMAEMWKKAGKFAESGQFKPLSGDLVFFKDNTVGIVSDVFSSTCYVICGDVNNAVRSSIVSFVDANIIGWGIVNPQIENRELYDISDGPAVFLFANEQKQEQTQAYSAKRRTTYGLLRATTRDLVDYLNENDGNYIFTLLDANDRPVPIDENGNYIIHADELYKITITISSPNGFSSDNAYIYNFPSDVELVSFGDDRFVVNETNDVGSWSINNEINLIMFDFNTNVDRLSDVIISVTVGVIFPKDKDQIDFDGKISITIEPPREEVLVTKVNKWGIQGDPNNADVINKTDKLDPSKIYWTVQIEGNKHSQIPGNVISDRVLKHDWSYEHYYTESDIARGLKFGVSVYDPETGNEEWHTWTVTVDDPNLTWNANGWTYVMPERIICTKNAYDQHELVLGNNNWTYFIEYSSTPTHVDIAGELGYANEITVENQRKEGWGGFTQAEVDAAVYKNGTLITDASGAKILWEIKATIPKMGILAPGEKADYEWIISDSLVFAPQEGTSRFFEDNDLKVSSVTANYFGTVVNVPHYSKATENDPYAYETYYWDSVDKTSVGSSVCILMRCACTEENCPKWKDGHCEPWHYWDGGEKVSAYCDCWTEIEDTTFTVVYETDVTEEIEQLGGKGYYAKNSAGVSNPNMNGAWTGSWVLLPGIVEKTDHEREGTIVKYSITVNEGKLNLTGDKPLIIHDEMTDTLAFMRGSLVIWSQDEQGNGVVLVEDVDYVYTYDGSGNNLDKNGNPVHILEIEIFHPQPVTYYLDYNTTLIMPKVDTPEDLEAVKYTNSATVYLWGGQASDSSTERIFPNINIASNAFTIFVHKLSAEDGVTPLKGAEFGLFNEQGGLIAKGTTGDDGKVYFQTDVKNGIVLREHKIYYVQELTAPPGYALDPVKYKFTFCNNADGTCNVFNDLKEEHDLTRVLSDTVGHIDVLNEPAYYNLPATGGSGTYPLIIASVTFIITPLLYMFIRRRKRERRDMS